MTGLAPGVRLVLTPGHTPGSATVLVAQAGQLVAIAGDAVDSRDFFIRREPSHNAVDPAAERRNFDLFAAIADVIVPGHGHPFRLEHGAPAEELAPPAVDASPSRDGGHAPRWRKEAGER